MIFFLILIPVDCSHQIRHGKKSGVNTLIYDRRKRVFCQYIFPGKMQKIVKKQEKETGMIGSCKIRTDLALESREKFEKDNVEIEGVVLKRWRFKRSTGPE